MLTIYGSSSSGNCLKVKWAAERLGLGFTWVEINNFAGETRTPAFLAINPAGQVPVVVLDDGRALAQSNAILLYLAEGSDLIPADAFARAKMFEWLFWEQYSHEPAIAVRIARLHFMGMAEADLDPALKTKGEAALARMELALAGADWLAGEALSLADIALVAYTRNAPKGGFDLSAYPALRAWIERVEAALGLERAV
ncbi:MAG TPA: glutathione S-transferase family protein [Terricaulis sp.]|nr:glutathione S-transferase family protein [Terricaulis sp.]